MQTSSGIKDQTVQDIIIKLIEHGCKLKRQLKKPKEPVGDDVLIGKQSEWLKSQPAKPFNILFQIHGLDPHCDTPIEILHTILLSVEKYAWHTFHSSTKPDAHKTFETRLQSSNILALEIDPIHASYIMNYKNNLIGCQLKMLMQLTVFHIHDLVHPNLFALVKAVGNLGAVLWYSEIHNLDLYLADLQILVDNVLDTFAQFDPRRILTKMKLHMLTHLVEDIQNHGPAVRFSTEIFECYNRVFCMCSILSNHQAPSRDIAQKMIELERFRHIVLGGFWQTSNGEVTCASAEVRRYFQTSLKLQTHLGWVKLVDIKRGEIKLHTTKNLHALSWQNTAGSKASLQGDFLSQQKWYEAESVTAASGDVCEVGFWVVATKDRGTVIGRIQQILMDAQTRVHGIIIVERFNIASERHPVLGMPILVQGEANVGYTTVVASYSIEFALNVQHDCLTLRCPTSGVENIRQERLNTTIQRQSIEHREEPIFIINMHALHNAQRTREVYLAI
ncbi:hypothetical protein FRC11_004889 [Ceratobasidium sp. 423]|nr:hypothetical protein FRC11_004889 [Ceratobasidium sp. 423]